MGDKSDIRLLLKSISSNFIRADNGNMFEILLLLRSNICKSVRTVNGERSLR